MSKKPSRKVRPARKAKTTPHRTPHSTSAKTLGSKLDQIASALRAPKGATISDLMELTGWQAHSVRGAIAGALKRDRGLAITSSKLGAERIYRIESGK